MPFGDKTQDSIFYAWVEHITSASNLVEIANRVVEVTSSEQKYLVVPLSTIDFNSKTRMRVVESWIDSNHFNSLGSLSIGLDLIRENRNLLLYWILDEFLNPVACFLVFRNSPTEFYFLFAEGDAVMQEIQLKIVDIFSHDFARDFLATDFTVVFPSEVASSQITMNLVAPENEDIRSGRYPHLYIYKFTKRDLPAFEGQILTAGPSITSLEVSYVNSAVRHGWNSNHSGYIKDFEQAFAERVGASFALSTSSCTGALHLALLACGIGPGDEVLVPSITWVATAAAVAYVGATPIFVDVNLRTWNIDIASADRKLSPKTRAIIPVHLYGFPAPMNDVIDFALRHGLKVIEDAAPAIGALVGSRPVGTFGQFGCYSFQGAKLLVTGEGGMLVTNDQSLYENAWQIQDHGRRPGTFWIERLGHKYKMNNVTAALGLAQLERAENQIEVKREIRQIYENLLGAHPNLIFQEEEKGTTAIHWMTSVRLIGLRGEAQKELMAYLSLHGIDSRPVFPSISRYTIWGKDYEPNINSETISDTSINLPSGVNLTHKSVERVSKVIMDWLRAHEG
jgi:perosamine synthetase